MPPTYVKSDSESALRILSRRLVDGRMRHVRLNISFTISAIEAQEIIARFVRTDKQWADYLTKSLSRAEFRQALANVGTPLEH
mmetsp:Transcript_25206/g.81512  ORF Transcript_25206/g.81512 Transcript_25206/m.81512 type:complete len:83 (+) Transcript_25206:1502-1750(+)